MAVADTYMTVSQAAHEIGVTTGRVRQMINDGEIKAEQVPAQENGRWLIPTKEVQRVAALQPKTGRPRGGGKR